MKIDIFKFIEALRRLNYSQSQLMVIIKAVQESVVHEEGDENPSV